MTATKNGIKIKGLSAADLATIFGYNKDTMYKKIEHLQQLAVKSPCKILPIEKVEEFANSIKPKNGKEPQQLVQEMQIKAQEFTPILTTGYEPKANNNAFKKQNQALTKKVETGEKQIQTLKEKLDAAEKRNQVLSKKVEAGERAKQTLAKKIEANEKRNQALSKKIEADERAKQTLTKKIEANEKQNQTLTKKIEANERQSKSLTQKIEDDKNESQTLKEEIEQLKNENNHLKKENSHLKSEKETLLSQLSTKLKNQRDIAREIFSQHTILSVLFLLITMVQISHLQSIYFEISPMEASSFKNLISWLFALVCESAVFYLSMYGGNRKASIVFTLFSLFVALFYFEPFIWEEVNGVAQFQWKHCGIGLLMSLLQASIIFIFGDKMHEISKEMQE